MSLRGSASIVRRTLAVATASVLLLAGAGAAAPRAAAGPVQTVHYTSDWVQGYTYGVGEPDIFHGTTVDLPRFDRSLGQLLGITIEYRLLWESETGVVYPSIDTGRNFVNRSTTSDTVVSYTSDLVFTGEVAGETFPTQTYRTWNTDDFAGVTVPAANRDFGQTPEVSKNLKTLVTFSPSQVNPYVGTGQFQLAVTVSQVESLITEQGVATVQGWESFGASYRVIYQYQSLDTVTPTQPTLSTPACGQTASVVLPEIAGLSYSASPAAPVAGDTVTVTATAQPGFVIATGATSTWTLTIPAIKACSVEVTPAGPTVSTPACGQTASVVLPEMTGLSYSASPATPAAGSSVVVTATAEAGYTIAKGAASTWTLTIPAVIPCTEVLDSNLSTGSLANTGADVEVGPAILGLASLIGGGALLLFRKRS